MATIFARRYEPTFRNPGELSGPCPDLTLREWEVAVILCSLPIEIEQALMDWLIAPTDHRRWPWLDSFHSHRLPLGADELRLSLDTACDLLWEEMKAIRQTLDFPFEVLHGIPRDLLLTAHGARLRQLIWAMGKRHALKEIERMTHPEAVQRQPSLQARPRSRWERLKRWLL
jgi:hypothetical protein